MENWKLSPAQLFTCNISDLIDFRKAHEASADALRNFGISEIYLTHGKKLLSRQKKTKWSRDLDLDSLISANILLGIS